MHWRKVRIVRGWLCWRKWSRSDDAYSHFRSFPPCLVSRPYTNVLWGELSSNKYCPRILGVKWPPYHPHLCPMIFISSQTWILATFTSMQECTDCVTALKCPYHDTLLDFRSARILLSEAIWVNLYHIITQSLIFHESFFFFILGLPGFPVLVSSANHGKTPCTKCLVITGDGFLPCPGKMNFQVLPTLKLVLSYWQWRSAS